MLLIAAGALALASCGPSAQNETEGEAETETVLAIEQEDISETQPVIRMEIDGELLPVLADVTTAEDNSVLAPVYLQRGGHKTIIRSKYLMPKSEYQILNINNCVC